MSIKVTQLPDIAFLPDAELPALLENFDARQILHVTFGSVLDHYSASFHRTLKQYESAYRVTLQRHFEKHLAPFQVKA